MPKKVWNSLIYTDEDEATLIRMFNEYMSRDDIALALKRSKDSVSKKIHKLKLKRNYRIVILVTRYGLEVLDRLSPEGTLSECQRGHPYNIENTFLFTSQNGRVYRQCKACRKLRGKLKYRNDPLHREKERVRALNRRHGAGLVRVDS